MKFDKPTKILLNLVLILVVALLLKSLIAVPRDLHAKGKVEYKIAEMPWPRSLAKNQNLIDKYVEEGWKLHSYIAESSYIIFER